MPTRRWGVLAAAGVAGLALVIVVATASGGSAPDRSGSDPSGQGSSSSGGYSGTEDPPATGSGTGPATPGTTGSGSPVDPGSTVPPSPEPASPKDELAAEVARDRTASQALVGYWVPQLSAKKLGLVVSGVRYGYAEILADFQQLRARYPDALLLWSGDFTSFKYPDYWVTVVPETYTDGESANSWCEAAGIGPDDCFAKRLSHTDPYRGNTLPRS
jgi:hypothetical protein